MDPSTIGKVGNKSDGKVDNAGNTGRVSSEAGATNTAGRAPSANDTVELTSRAQLLERVEKSLQALPAIDSQRVSEIKSAIENGDYEINAEAIADAMIRFERSMGD